MPSTHVSQRSASRSEVEVSRVLEDRHADFEVAHAEAAASVLATEELDCVLMDLGLSDAWGVTGMRRLLELAPAVTAA